MVKNKWWCFSEAISKENCKKIIDLADQYYNAQLLDGEVHTTVRKCLVHGRREQWLYDLFWPYMNGANEEAGWKYDIEAAEGKNRSYEYNTTVAFKSVDRQQE